MVIKDIISFVGKRQLAALGILASVFAVLMAFHINVWSFIAVSVLFIGYASWTATAFLATQQNFSGRGVTACAWPVGIATVQAVVCFGLVDCMVSASRVWPLIFRGTFWRAGRRGREGEYQWHLKL